VLDPSEVVHEMRLFKTEAELEMMRRAADITCEAHRAAMAAAHPGVHEYELEALIEYTFRRSGAVGPSYSSIVGSGPNATILHYVENSRRVRENDLVLVDAGAEYGYYAADVTRTWPASGRFTDEQRAVYEVVLAAQVGAIEMSRPGVTMQEIHDFTVRTLTEGLVRLGLLEGPVERAIEQSTFKKFYMHKTGHYLGMDVHDVGKYRENEEWRKLAPGMVMTIEPGLYIAEDCEDVDERWRGIGVRIEDDILVTDSGHEVLTAAAPKTVEEIERAVGSEATVGK
jgi:Xaa-Pro aminopeptidase